jgi:hypothetical protein
LVIDFHCKLSDEYPGQYRLIVMKDMTPKNYGGLDFPAINSKILYALANGKTALYDIFNSTAGIKMPPPMHIDKLHKPCALRLTTADRMLFERFRRHFFPDDEKKMPTTQELFFGISKRLYEREKKEDDEVAFYGRLIDSHEQVVEKMFKGPLTVTQTQKKEVEWEPVAKKRMSLAGCMTKKWYDVGKTAGFFSQFD